MIRKEYRVVGIVQGVGFRPFVDCIAKKNGCTGTVCNKGPYVEIHVQASKEQVAAFRKDLEALAPSRSAILKIEEKTLPVQEERTFQILHSQKVKGDIFVSPDIAICPDCQRELFDPSNRRYLHPFINCTACGPRLTILDSMPYDRVRTSMKDFPMCPSCEKEYTSITSRRYHAQPVCCNDCGPELYLVGQDVHGKDALRQTRQTIVQGGIVAIKGIGGFHLCCDATNPKVVQRLRTIKNRPFKPFAVMVRNMEVARREAEIRDGQEEVLDGYQKPILLLKKKAGKIVPEVAPDNPNIGLILPYAPVQLLLFDYPDEIDMPDCLVMTSANPKGAPICRTDQDVIENLSDICDLVLSNNRPIRLRADDSVLSWFDHQPMMIRRSRGYAPLPFMMHKKGDSVVLGIGGELKNTFCLAAKDLYYPSPYIGDLSDIRSVQALKEAIERMEELLEMRAELIVCDMHPAYQSRQLAYELGRPVLECQHHYAHILSCMAEHQIDQEVIGISFDGTGYGLDGTIWGGEFFICDTHTFKRVGSLEPFEQVGGDLSSKEGWRNAVSILDKEDWQGLDLCSQEQAELILQCKAMKINTVTSTSAGRYFDAVSAILGLRKVNTCEAEASMVLQFAAESYQGKALDVPISMQEADFFILPMKALCNFLAQAKKSGEDIACLAYTFHVVLAHWICEGALQASRQTQSKMVVLSGGVMQNVLLLKLCKEELEAQGFTVLTHKLSSSNDGGIGLGQAYYGMENIRRTKVCVSDYPQK